MKKNDIALIERIVIRAAQEMDGVGDADLVELREDLMAAHSFCPLRLSDLLAADLFNFSHDVSGITHNITRNRNGFGNCFRPRFARRQ